MDMAVNGFTTMLKGLLNTAVRAALSYNCHEYRHLFLHCYVPGVRKKTFGS